MAQPMAPLVSATQHGNAKLHGHVVAAKAIHNLTWSLSLLMGSQAGTV